MTETRVVPVEPTEAMMERGIEAFASDIAIGGASVGDSARSMWRAMLSAAPPDASGRGDANAKKIMRLLLEGAAIVNNAVNFSTEFRAMGLHGAQSFVLRVAVAMQDERVDDSGSADEDLAKELVAHAHKPFKDDWCNEAVALLVRASALLSRPDTGEGEEPCPVCGNEVRGQGGYLSCECPAPKRIPPGSYTRETMPPISSGAQVIVDRVRAQAALAKAERERDEAQGLLRECRELLGILSASRGVLAGGEPFLARIDAHLSGEKKE